MPQNHIGAALIGTTNMIRRHVHGAACGGKMSLTAMQHFFLGAIYHNSQQGTITYQKDLEAKFSLRRSTASGILSLMEETALIRRETCEHDARLKALILTDKALELCMEREREIADFEKRITKGLTQEEIDTLFSILERIRKNIENEEFEEGKE